MEIKAGSQGKLYGFVWQCKKRREKGRVVLLSTPCKHGTQLTRALFYFGLLYIFFVLHENFSPYFAFLLAFSLQNTVHSMSKFRIYMYTNIGCCAFSLSG